MDLSRYPDADDIEALMKSIRIWPVGADDSAPVLYAREQCTIAAAAAAAEWETVTGWQPFLSSGAVTTRYFSALDNAGLLQLGGGLLSLTGMTVAGTTKTVNTDFWLDPANAGATGLPYTALRFGYAGGWAGSWSGTPNQYAVTGIWGRVVTMPADAWQAVQQKAALTALLQIENQQSVANISMDGFSKGLDIVGINAPKDLAERWGKQFLQQAARYMRVVIV